MRSRYLFWSCVALVIAGCGELGTQTDFSSGRRALLRAEPDNALSYFEKVAASDPGFVHVSGALRESIWTYIGRAHYNSGRYVQAKAAFDRALQQSNDEHLARLYGGLSLLRPAPAKSGAAANPFTLQQLTYALREGVEPRRVAALARERGVGFDLSRETESQLSSAGADAGLLGEIRKIRAEALSRGNLSEAQTAQASKELRAALTGLDEWINYTIYKTPMGRFWDPGKEIRAQIKNGLGLVAARQLDVPAIIANGELLAYLIAEEPARARRDEDEEVRRQQRR